MVFQCDCTFGAVVGQLAAAQRVAITMARTALILILAIVPCFCQRPFYAGLRPIGYPETPAATGIFDRFSNEPIPAQLNGDRNYANQLNALPVDNQPFFFVNRDKVAENLKNPQTYPQRPSGFNENNRNTL
uniref:SFRICE_022197 n=1 Tax=Spodoptera frugiperda TaxID=7108 RepID=A0A2H1VV24_SPOFR